MKSVYIIPLSIVFLIVGLVMGYLAKEVYEHQRPKEDTFNPFLSDIMLYEDDDFLHSFQGIQNQLNQTEKALGQKLISCIEQKKEAVRTIAKMEDELDEQSANARNSFIDRFLGETEKQEVTFIPGGLAPMFDSDTPNPVPLRIVDSRYQQLFPNMMFKHPKEESFGFYQKSVDDVQAFLDKRVVQNPDMSIVDLQRKRRSKFFQELKTSAFEGGVTINTEGAQDRVITGRLIFQSPTQNGMDWILATDDQGATIETRTFAQVDESVWRYNSKNPSVILLSERCFWNDQYVYEFKDIFYLTQQEKLVGNIYCKKQNADKWDRVGTLNFDKIAD